MQCTMRHGWQFAYTTGFAALDLAWLLLTLTQRAREWKRPLLAGSIDIPAAFDNMRHDAIAIAMKQEGFERDAVIWMLDTLRATRIKPELGELELEPMQMYNGLSQGNKVPTVFTLTLGSILNPLWKQLSGEGAGVEIGNVVVPFVVFSDNVGCSSLDSIQQVQQTYN